eukprot:gene10511-7479_t
MTKDTSIHSIAAALDESIMTFVDYLVAQKILPNRDAVPDHFHASMFDYVSREQRYLQSLMQLVTTSNYVNPEEWPTQVTPGPTALLGELAEEEGDTWQDVLAQVANQLKDHPPAQPRPSGGNKPWTSSDNKRQKGGKRT